MRDVSGRTKVIGLLGSPLHHSPLPRLFNEALGTVPFPFVMVPFPILPQALAEAAAAAKTMRLAGLCVSSPFKEALLPLLDEAGPTTMKTKSVDTVSLAGGRLSGHNTELWSFLAAVKDEAGLPLMGKRVLLVGSGGTARSIAAALLMEGVARLTVANRTTPRAQMLAKDLSKRFPRAEVPTVPYSPAEFHAALRDADLLVNATPSDLQASQGPLVLEKDLHPALTVFDAAYQPSTPLLVAARRAGCPALSGTRMLLWRVFFGVRQWTGHEPDRAVIERALDAFLAPPIAA